MSFHYITGPVEMNKFYGVWEFIEKNVDKIGWLTRRMVQLKSLKVPRNS